MTKFSVSERDNTGRDEAKNGSRSGHCYSDVGSSCVGDNDDVVGTAVSTATNENSVTLQRRP